MTETSKTRHFIEVSSDELRDLIDALVEITGDKGREYESANEPRFTALLHRFERLLDDAERLTSRGAS